MQNRICRRNFWRTGCAGPVKSLTVTSQKSFTLTGGSSMRHISHTLEKSPPITTTAERNTDFLPPSVISMTPWRSAAESWMWNAAGWQRQNRGTGRRTPRLPATPGAIRTHWTIKAAVKSSAICWMLSAKTETCF